MARYTGKDLAINFGSTALEADYRSLSTSEEIDTAESTAGDDAHKEYLPTIRDTTIDVELLDVTGATGETLWTALAPGTSDTLDFGPAGDATGATKYSGTAFVVNREREFPYDDVVQIKISFQLTTVLTKATYA